MFFHTSRLQFESKPDKPDPVYAHKLQDGQDGGWASGPQPDGQHEFGYLAKPEPLGDVASVPAPDHMLYATYNGAMGKPSGPALGTETGLAGKIKDAFS